jgi:arylsulfatase
VVFSILHRPARLALLLAAGVLPCCGGSDPSPRPDVLLLVVDTLRADHLGCYGYPRPTSPNLDALAARGVLFEQVTAQSSWTLPSMSSMLAGKYLTAHRMRPDPEHALLAESFAAAGYHTVGIVANTLLRAEDGFARGFDEYHVCEPGKTSFDALLGWLEEPLALASKKNERGERAPLFLYVQAFDPHAPYLRHPEYDKELPPREAVPVDNAAWQRASLAERGPAPPPEDPEWNKALADIQRRRGLYDQEVRYSDAGAGKLLDRLAALGFGERLVVAVVADHGEGLWEQLSRMDEAHRREAAPDTFFFGAHGQDLSQQALHTPFLLQAKGLPSGLRIDAPVENVDLFPTLLHLANLPLPAGLHGRDLLPLVEDPATAWRDASFSFVIHSATVLDEASGWKLVVPTEGLVQLEAVGPTCDYGTDSPGAELAGAELYDLHSDPVEHINRIQERLDEAKRLLTLVSGWIERYPTRKSTRADVDPDLEERMRQQGYAGSLTGEDGDEATSGDTDSPVEDGGKH